MQIHILSGLVRTGKTTRLAAWAARQPGTAGLLMPDTTVGRVFRDVGTGAEWPAAAAPNAPDPLLVGRFRFGRAAFGRAGRVLLAAAAHPATRWLLVDEIGPLELRGEGLAPALRRVLARAAPAFGLVLVVREGLREAVEQAFGLGRTADFQFPITPKNS